jgi:2'-5' RNA ligase
MPYAIQAHFDPVADTTVRDCWRRLTEIGIAAPSSGSAARPHLTLAGYDTLDVARAAHALATFARSRSAFPLTFSHLGAFLSPSTVLFLGPTPTATLLHFQRAVHEMVTGIGMSPWEHYLPERWVPHCTIALNIDAATLPRAIAASQDVRLPFSADVVEIGVTEVNAVDLLFAVGLPARRTMP